MAAGFLSERKQKLPGLLKPELRRPGAFLPSHAISQSNYKADLDSGGGKRLHILMEHMHTGGGELAALEVICHSEKVPILFL